MLLSSSWPRHIFEDIDPFVKDKSNRIVGFYILGDAIYGLLSFRLKSPKHSVPNNECRTVILIDIISVRGMMHTVMRWSREEELYRCRKFADILGVNPELIQNCNLMADEEYERIEAHEHHRQKEYNLDMLGPTQSK